MQTRRFPRTMQEAFGPYTDDNLYEPQRPMDWEDKVVLTGCVVTAIIFLVCVFLRYI